MRVGPRQDHEYFKVEHRAASLRIKSNKDLPEGTVIASRAMVTKNDIFRRIKGLYRGQVARLSGSQSATLGQKVAHGVQ